MVRGAFPSKGVGYPKTDEKPPSMTRAEIERGITPAMSEAERNELWACLYLTEEELPQLLARVEGNAAHPWVYPLVCFVAHTGSRRGETPRVDVEDIGFGSQTPLVREKKRSRKQRTTLRVSLTPFLAGVPKEWLAVHPGGSVLFRHKSEKTRASSLKGQAPASAPRKKRPERRRACILEPAVVVRVRLAPTHRRPDGIGCKGRPAS